MTLTGQWFFATAAIGGMLALGSLVRARRAIADWAFCAGMAVLAAENIFSGLAANTTWQDQIIYWQQWRLSILSLLPGVWLFFSLSFARGNARQFLSAWRFSLLTAFVLPVGLSLIFHRHLLDSADLSPTGLLLHLGWAGVLEYLVMLVGSVLIVTNLERTYRAAVGTMRWRIKFMLMGVGVLFIVRMYTSSQALLFRLVDPSLQLINSAGLLVAALLILRSALRSGRFHPDVYPSRSVLQGSLTILLAGVYLLIVGVFAKVAAYYGGNLAFALVAFWLLVSLVLLTVLLQSDRLRLALRRFVSRHFQRPLYDYGTMWRKFTEGTAAHVEQTELCRALVRLVTEMFQILSVTIWLVDDKRESLNLAASTSLPEAVSRHPFPQQMESVRVLDYFRHHPEPVDIDLATGDWANALRRWQPGEFPNGGHRLAIPLVGRGELIGLIILGDRVAGVPFDLQDTDMLKCVADHAAGSLLNVQLSQKLLQAKELEAFQTMATFFVHDLKNAATTLNLMLQNLPVHFDDPVFREDALRGISKTAAHIDRLVGRLGLLRHELKIQPTEVDLRELVASALAGMEGGLKTMLVKDLQLVPKIWLDQEQILKVIVNLVLNANEAVAENGQIRVTTGPVNEWAVLTVTDTGCGMSLEFLNRSLFRPFQTTKKNGLGIGMFQSKMIVEAHRGRITVASEPGKGTTFQVFLPIRP